jgi:ribosomal protein L7/L12
MARSKKLPDTEDFCFVVMPFGGKFDRYYSNVFAPAIEAAGLRARRADSIFRPSPILDDIWALTRQATLLLADMTGKAPNVFYEVGLAHALARPVVLVASSLEDVPFDLRGLRVLIYDKDNESWGEDLRSQITSSMRETLRDTRSAVPLTFLGTALPKRPQEEPLHLELRRLSEEVRALRLFGAETRVEYKEVEVPIPVLIPADLIQRLKQLDGTLFKEFKSDPDILAVLTEILGQRKIHAIKITRERTSLGLKEAKDLMDQWIPLLRDMNLLVEPQGLTGN